jgi:twinkle protein
MKSFEDFGIKLPTKGKSGQVHTQCPSCSSQRRKKKASCLSVNIDEGVWLCHHCGWAGSLANGKDSTGSSALHWRKPRYVKPEPLPVTSLKSTIVKWFGDRGISETTLVETNIGERKVYMPQIEDFTMAIAFPYYVNGELINVKYRDHRKNFRLEAGAQRCFYGVDDITNATSIVIVEGEIDKLSLWEAGIRTCLSVPDGAPPVNSTDYSSKFDYLNDSWLLIQLKSIEKIIIAVDNDEPGNKLEEELSRRLGKEKCHKVVWPEGCKDANEVLVKYGKTVLSECISHAKPYPIAGTYNADNLTESIDRLYESGVERGVSTGWGTIDPYYLVRPGAFTVVTGIPSSGKSNWMDAVMVNISKEHGWNFAIFSPENQPLEDHMARVLEKYIGQPFTDGPTPRMTKKDLNEGKAWLTKHFTWILPSDDKEWSIDVILDAAKRLVLTKGIRGLVIDPWNELEHMRDNNQTETEYISVALKRIRQFGRRYGIHIWVIAHPAKLYRDKSGKIPIPTPYDISGSARWRDKSDNCITIWRDLTKEEGCLVEVHVQKVRFRQDGKIGKGELSYNWRMGTYHLPLKAAQEIPPAYG